MLRFDESSTIGSHLKLAVTSELIGILAKSDSCVALQRQSIVAMAVVTHIRVYITAILTTQDGLELLIDRLLCTERLQLIQGVLPVELATLLLPLMISLNFFLLLVCVSELTNLS